MNVLFLSPKIHIDPPVMAAGKVLAQRGHDVLALGYAERDQVTRADVSRGFSVHRVVRWRRLPWAFRRAVNLCAYVRAAMKAAHQFRPQVVVAASYEVLPIAAYLARRVGGPFIYYALEYIPRPGPRELFSGWGVFKLLERKMVQNASFVISVEENRAGIQAKEWARQIDCIVLNCPVYDADYEAAAAMVPKEPEGIRCVYAGQIARRNCIGQLMEVMDRSPQVTLDLFGAVQAEYADAFGALQRNSVAFRDGRVRYKGRVPHETLQKVLPNYDVGFALYDNSSRNTEFASPAKLGEYMKAGLVVISTDQPTPARVLAASRCGYTVPAPSLSGLDAICRALVDDSALVPALRANALRAFRREFAFEHQFAPVLRYLDAHKTAVPLPTAVKALGSL